MSEGKYVDEVYKYIKALPDDYPRPLEHLIAVAVVMAKVHPVWYSLFVVRAWFVRNWRWVISGTWYARSKRRDGSNASGAGT